MESYSLIFRTGETLLNQWKILKGCCLLADQSSDLEHNKKSLFVATHDDFMFVFKDFVFEINT